MGVADPLPRTSERTVLRRLDAADLAEFQAYRCDPVVARYQSWHAMSDSEARSFLTEMNLATCLAPGHWFQIGIVRRAINTLIGDVGICVAANEEHAEIGFSLNRRSQGQGLASEAVREAISLVFEHSGVTQIVGVTDARNLPSIRLLERVGMRRTETLETLFRGEPCVEHVYAIVRDDVR